MRQINLSLVGGPRLTLTRGGDQFLYTPTRVAWPDGERPVLHGGMQADHLSIPLKVRTTGRHVGKLWLHLTYPDGYRQEVAAVDPEVIVAIMQRFETGIGERFRAETFRVEPEELADLGIRVWLPKPSLQELLGKALAKPRHEYRVTTSDVEKLSKHLRRASALTLRERWVRELRSPILAYESKLGLQLQLGYFPTWLDDGPPGWFATPYPFLGEEAMDELIMRCFPVEFWRNFYVVARELQAPVDREKLRQLATTL